MAITKWFNKTILLERKTESRDTTGAVIPAWATHLTVSGSLRPLSGDERVSAEKQNYFADHRIYVLPADIQADKDRAKIDGNIYLIKFVKNVMSMNVHLEIDCEYIK